MTKPFDHDVLRARLQAGERVVTLHLELADRVDGLQRALTQVKRLEGLLPICSYCKRVQTARGYWEQVESYISARPGVQFSHGICPECYHRYVGASIEGSLRAYNRPPKKSEADEDRAGYPDAVRPSEFRPSKR